MKRVSVVIPAFNEAACIAETLAAVRSALTDCELIVVDDGSRDGTAEAAKRWADEVIVLPRRRGKGEALQTGWKRARGATLLLLDADLKGSAGEAVRLLPPVEEGRCDMAVARLPAPARRAGFGLAKGLARHGIFWLTGYRTAAPLSGQRAVRREVLDAVAALDSGFGIEVSLTIAALRAGYRVEEVPVELVHRERGNDWVSVCHRGRQFFAVARALARAAGRKAR